MVVFCLCGGILHPRDPQYLAGMAHTDIQPYLQVPSETWKNKIDLLMKLTHVQQLGGK